MRLISLHQLSLLKSTASHRPPPRYAITPGSPPSFLNLFTQVLNKSNQFMNDCVDSRDGATTTANSLKHEQSIFCRNLVKPDLRKTYVN